MWVLADLDDETGFRVKPTVTAGQSLGSDAREIEITDLLGRDLMAGEKRLDELVRIAEVTTPKNGAASRASEKGNFTGEGLGFS